MKKTDLFKADRAMSERVAEFMRTKVWGVTLKARCKKQVQEDEEAIKGLKNLEGSIHADKARESITALEAHIVEVQNKLAEQLEEEAKFDLTENDKTFYKTYKAENADVHQAIIDWFATYKLEVSKDSDIVLSIYEAISGKKRASGKIIINSGATQFTEEKRTKTDVIGLFYGTLAERMLEVGTLKPVAIQEDVREFYAPKKKEKKSK